jgi:soluble lytic murein transglycosylase-like protein
MERFMMRACVVLTVVVAFVQPALARDHSRKAHDRAETPIESGYAMPKTFEEAEARRPRRQRAWQPVTAQPSGFAPAMPANVARGAAPRDGALDAMIARHAAANGLPAELVHRVVVRESRYNARARGAGGALGLMQIKHATARGMGYAGPASGLLDAETNLTYATRYLAGAYRAAGGNAGRAVALYASGYHGRGVTLARRAPAAAAQNAWGQDEWQQNGWDMQAAPVSMQADGATDRPRRTLRHFTRSKR